MNNKKFFGATLIGLFSLATAATVANFSSTFVKTNAFNQPGNHRDAEQQYSASSFVNSVTIERDELTVDVQSLTSTPTSKSATIAFNSSRITGWGTSKKNVYVVIDDKDYSGSQTSPSISGKTNPVFDGYTIEMANIATFTFSYGDVKIQELVIPETLTYSNIFSVSNKKILEGTFDFNGTPKFERMIIPAGIETIESGAFKHIPSTVEIKCEAESKPATWASDWIDDASNVEWGYVLKGEETTGRRTNNEVDQKIQTIGTATKAYGKLANSAASSDNRIFSIVEDVNWTGDFDNPVRSSVGLEKPYKLDSFVRYIEDEGEDIVIPEQMTYGSDLILVNKRIETDGIPFNYTEDESNNKVYAGSLKSITIPKGIEVVEAGSFVDVPSNVQIRCEAPSKPDLWNDRWTDAPASQIVWGVHVDDADRTVVVGSTEREFRLSNEATTYILGYKYEKEDKFWCSECKVAYTQQELVDGKCPKCGHAVEKLTDTTPEYQLPLVVSYDVKNSRDNSVKTVWHEMPLLSEEPTSTSTSYYDSVRSEIHSRSFDILLEDNEEFVETSVKVYNVYRAKTVKIKSKVVEGDKVVEKYINYRIPDTSVSFVASALKRYEKEVNVNQLVKYNFKGLTQFLDYSMVSMTIDKVLPSYWFEGMSPEVISSFKDKIDDGSYSVRYALYNLSNSFYRLTYYSPTVNDEVTVTVPIKTPNPVVILEKDVGNDVSLLIQNSSIVYKEGNRSIADFQLKNLKQFEIIGLTVNIHLWNNAQSIKVGRTDLSTHFGSIDVMPKAVGAPKITNISTITLITELIILAVYAAGTAGLFFFFKEKYKNDEFRRVKPKKFFKTAIIGYIGVLVVSVTLLFIIFRGTVFNNAISTHNPTDIFIVIPGVISIIVIGYFIKFIVDKVKANKKRKEALKLKLNEDAADDGTK